MAQWNRVSWGYSPGMAFCRPLSPPWGHVLSCPLWPQGLLAAPGHIWNSPAPEPLHMLSLLFRMLLMCSHSPSEKSELEWQGQKVRLCVLGEAGGPEKGFLPALHLCLTCPQPGTCTQPSPVTTLTQETHSHPWSPPCPHPAAECIQLSSGTPVSFTQTWNSPVSCKAPGFPLFLQNHTGARLSWESYNAN